MEKNTSIFITLAILIIYVSCTAGNKAKKEVKTSKTDVLELIYSVADKMEMKIMCDIDMRGGDLYQERELLYRRIL